ncbi:IFI27 protein, partial [Oceanites oceanicus]|nr:IFI27 protein [Oceanites oceanicus]
NVTAAALRAGLSMAVPAALYIVGFTKGGIAAGSLAARMMSLTAIANGGRVAAGSLVAIAQSLGAAGFSLGTTIGLTSVLGPLGAAAGAKLF